MLPSAIYELMPGSYLLIGSSLINTSDNPLVVIAGCLFFVSGTWIWILRSNNRRVDKGVKYYMLIFRHFYLPDTLYELLPFINIFTGIILIRLQIHPAVAITGAVFITWAFYCIAKRYLFRKHPYNTNKYKLYKPQK